MNKQPFRQKAAKFQSSEVVAMYNSLKQTAHGTYKFFAVTLATSKELTESLFLRIAPRMDMIIVSNYVPCSNW